MTSFRVGSFVRTVLQTAGRNGPLQSQAAHIRRMSGQVKPPPNPARLALKGLGVGLALGTAYAGYTHFSGRRTDDHKIHERDGPYFIDRLPDVAITRKIVNNKDDSDLELVLFQYQTCPFCCKVRAFLDYHGFSYSIVEVDAVLRQSIRWSPYKKVPMLLAKTKDGQYVQLTDSTMIVSTLASFLTDKSQDVGQLAKFYPNISFLDESGAKKIDIMNKYFLMFQGNEPRGFTKDMLEEERKWRTWADSTLVHLISPNVYRNTSEALATFKWFSDVGDWSEAFPAWERNLMVYVGAVAMWAISKRLKKRHGLSDNVRGHLYEACDNWTEALGKKKTVFMGGKKPNLADLAVFGVLNSMEGCDAFDDVLDNTSIGGWFYAVKEHVVRNKGLILGSNIVA